MAATLELGKTYRNRLGQEVRIIYGGSMSQGPRIVEYFVGVHETWVNGNACPISHTYQPDGWRYGGSTDHRLGVFDWRDLKRDDVIEIARGSCSVKRYVCRLEENSIVMYADGVSSITFDPACHATITEPCSDFIRLVKKNPDPAQ